MKQLILCILIFASATSFAQKQLSQQAINEMVNKVSAFLGYEQNEKVRSAFNRYLNTYNSAGAATAMANLRNDLKGKDDFLIILNRATGSREMLAEMLSAINVNSRIIPEITDYFFPRTVSQKPKLPDTAKFIPDTSAKKPTDPVVFTDPSKKFFDGRKSFCDSTGKWHYSVTIIRSNIILSKYEGQPSKVGQATAPLVKFKGYLSGENIVTEAGVQSNFKYENNMFYEKPEGSEMWTKYVECAEK